MAEQAFDYAEAILRAAEIVAGKCLNEIAYDVTEICTVVDESDSKNGKYIVTNGAIKYDAYVSTSNGATEIPQYKKDDMVRVSIMNKDYSQKKYIIGLHVTDNDTLPVTYVSPLDTVLDMSDNIMDTTSSEYLWSLTANSDIEEICLWSTNLTQASYRDLQNNSIYDTISLKGDFKSLMSQYSIKDGSYGLRLDMYVKPTNDSEDYIIHRAYLRNEDMFGNPYSYLVFSTQAIKFDIKELGTIDTISLYFYQKRDFTYYTEDGQLQSLPVTRDKDGNLIPNLLVKNLYLSFGSDITEIDDNTVKIYTNDPSTFDTNNTNISYNTKDIALLWYNKDEDGKYLGFSDGYYDPNYDELQYLAESEFDSRLTAQQGRDVPSDYNGLKLSADIEEAQVLINSLKNLITKDLYQNTLSFQSRVSGICAINSDIQKAFDLVIRTDNGTVVTTGETLEQKTEELVTYYTEILSRAKMRQDAEVDAIPSQQGLKKISPEQTVSSVATLINSVNALLNTSQTVIFDNYTGFKSIWESFNTRLTKLIEKITNTRDNFLTLLKDNQALLDGYYALQYEFTPYVKTDFSDYENKYCIYWYRYNPESQEAPDRFMEKGWDRLTEKNLGVPNKSVEVNGLLFNDKKPAATEGILTKELNLALAEEKFAAIVFYNHEMFKSNVLTFTNENPPVTPKDVDQNAALYIQHYADSQDSYQLYGVNNCLINAADAYRTRHLRIRYDGEKGKDEQLIDSQVFWYIPLDSTMLTYSFDDYSQEFSHDFFDEVASEDHKEGYICFYRKIEKENSSENLNEKHTVFPYRIKDYYSSTFAQNDIICKVKTADNRILETSLLFSFSSYGTSGTDYTLKVAPAGSKSAFDYELDDNEANLNLDVTLFDYNNEVIDIPADENTTVGWIGPSPYVAALQDKEIGEGETLRSVINNCLITIDEEADKGPNEGYYHAVLKTVTKFTLPEEEKDTKKKRRTIDLTTITAIPYAAGREYFIEGASIVVYDSSGANPTYYKNPFRIFSKNLDDTKNKEIEDVNWDIIYYTDTNEILDKSKVPDKYKLLYSYMPYLGEDNELIPCSMFLACDDKNDYKGARLYPVVTCRSKGVVIWAQPIYLMQNRYASAMLNAWDGSLQIDEENGTIMSSMVGAGRKTTNNTFEGVLMGDVGGQVNGDNATGIGLYGYHDGAQSFYFGVNGTAFLGKSGRGRILLDGNKGTISSASYQQTRNDNGTADAGMMIDLDDGFIDILGATQNTDGDYLPDGTRSRIHTNVKAPYFFIVSDTGHRLINIGNSKDKDGNPISINITGYDSAETTDDSEWRSIHDGGTVFSNYDKGFYLKSDNFKNFTFNKIDGGEHSDSGAGFFLDLITGRMNSFNLNIASKNIFIDSSEGANPYFIIKDDDGCNLMYVGQKNFYIQSHTYARRVAGDTAGTDSNGNTIYYPGMKINTDDKDFLFDIQGQYQSLFTVSKNNLFLQTDNYISKADSDTGYGKGLRIDLKGGNIDAYDFVIRGEASTGKNKGSYILLDSKSTKFVMHLALDDSDGIVDLDLINVSPTNFILQSSNWLSETSDNSTSIKVADCNTNYHVRSGPGTNYDIVGYTTNRPKVTLYEGPVSGQGDSGWYAISSDKTEWVAASAMSNIRTETTGGSSTTGSGMQIDMNDGAITLFNPSSPGKNVLIASEESYPFQVGPINDRTFRIGWDGALSGGTTYSWSINSSGKATFNSLTVNGGTFKGYIYAYGGTIGGCTISGGSISGGNWSLNAEGTITIGDIEAEPGILPVLDYDGNIYKAVTTKSKTISIDIYKDGEYVGSGSTTVSGFVDGISDILGLKYKLYNVIGVTENTAS